MKFSLQYAIILSQKYLNIDDDIIPEIEMCLEREGDRINLPYEVEDLGIKIHGDKYKYNNDNDDDYIDNYIDNGDNYGDGDGNGDGDSYGYDDCYSNGFGDGYGSGSDGDIYGNGKGLGN